jgi:hypothetical protein
MPNDVPVSNAPAPSTFAAKPKDNELLPTLQPPSPGVTSFGDRLQEIVRHTPRGRAGLVSAGSILFALFSLYVTIKPEI